MKLANLWGTAPTPETAPNPYLEQFTHGTFKGVLTWEALDALWGRVAQRAGEGWYVYDLAHAPPGDPFSETQLADFLARTGEWLRQRQKQDHCGMVYVDSHETPAFLLVYDPKNAGSSCGVGGKRTLPAYTVSLLSPVDLKLAFD